MDQIMGNKDVPEYLRAATHIAMDRLCASVSGNGTTSTQQILTLKVWSGLHIDHIGAWSDQPSRICLVTNAGDVNLSVGDQDVLENAAEELASILRSRLDSLKSEHDHGPLCQSHSQHPGGKCEAVMQRMDQATNCLWALLGEKGAQSMLDVPWRIMTVEEACPILGDGMRLSSNFPVVDEVHWRRSWGEDADADGGSGSDQGSLQVMDLWNGYGGL